MWRAQRGPGTPKSGLKRPLIRAASSSVLALLLALLLAGSLFLFLVGCRRARLLFVPREALLALLGDLRVGVAFFSRRFFSFGFCLLASVVAPLPP